MKISFSSCLAMAVQTYRVKASLSIVNLDMLCGEGMMEGRIKHSDLLPNHVRCIMCGPSGSGKTNVMLNLLFDPNGLKYENVYVFSKSLYQPKYKLLERVLTSTEGMGYFPFTDNDEVVDPSDVLKNSVMVFDDVACEKQNKIRNYFTMGRHSNVNTFYLCQTYSRVPKQLVRDNANFIVLFAQDGQNLKHVYEDHVNTDMSYSTFKQMCTQAWNSGPNKFLVIDKELGLRDGRYRFGLDEYVRYVDEGKCKEHGERRERKQRKEHKERKQRKQRQERKEHKERKQRQEHKEHKQRKQRQERKERKQRKQRQEHKERKQRQERKERKQRKQRQERKERKQRRERGEYKEHKNKSNM